MTNDAAHQKIECFASLHWRGMDLLVKALSCNRHFLGVEGVPESVSCEMLKYSCRSADGCIIENQPCQPKMYFLNSESFSACVEKWPLKPHFLDYSKS